LSQAQKGQKKGGRKERADAKVSSSSIMEKKSQTVGGEVIGAEGTEGGEIDKTSALKWDRALSAPKYMNGKDFIFRSVPTRWISPLLGAGMRKGGSLRKGGEKGPRIYGRGGGASEGTRRNG